MNTCFKKIASLIYFFVFSITLLLASCASTQSGYNSNKGPLLSAKTYLQLAATAEGEKKQMYLLKAATRYIQDRQITDAQRILNSLPAKSLAANLVSKRQLIQARALILSHKNRAALQLLNTISAKQTLSREEQIDCLRLTAYAYQQLGNISSSIQKRAQVLPLITDQAEKKQDLGEIWQTLQDLNQPALSRFYQQADSNDVRGWFSFALATRNSAYSTKQLAQSLKQWRNQYPNHPANLLLPNKLQNLIHPKHQPKQIAILLPLSGKRAKAGDAIRNGFFAAYYNAKKIQNSSPILRVYDTTSEPIHAIYQQAVKQGAEFIVGPLTKNNLSQLLTTTKLSVPTLALNTLTNYPNSPNDNLFEFGLSPIDEAQQVAKKAWRSHYSHALIIAPASPWGQKIIQTFSDTWQKLGGRIVGTMPYQNQKNLAKDVSNLLNVKQSQQRARQLRRLIHQKIRFVPRRRKDADIIFLVANPTMARQIKPLLKYFYAGDIPVYAISKIYSGIPNAKRDRDLNGVIFCEMPWVLPFSQKSNNLIALRQESQHFWSASYRHYSKLYALGVDAYDIIPNLNRMALLPQLGVKAATGTLFLNKQHHLYRKLVWTQMVNGTPHIIQ